MTCLKIKSIEFAKTVQPFYKELDWKWVVFKKSCKIKRDKKGLPVYMDWLNDGCVREVPSVDEIVKCCHDLLDDMKKNGHIGLATGGVVVEPNDYGGVIRFNNRLGVARAKQTRR